MTTNKDLKDGILPELLITVRHMATRENALLPGYRQYWEAHKGDVFLGAVYSPPAPDFPADNERIVVQERYVATKSGTSWEAIERYREWLSKGHTDNWLMEI